MSEETTNTTTEEAAPSPGADLNQLDADTITQVQGPGQPEPGQQQQLFGSNPAEINASPPNETAVRTDEPQAPPEDITPKEEPPQEEPAPEQPQEEETPAEEPAPEEPAPETPEEPAPEDTAVYDEPEQVEVFSDHISHHSDGRIQSLEDLNTLIAERDTLIEENQRLQNRPTEPEFTSESAKQLYEFAKGFDGSELNAARNYLRVMSLDLDKLSEKNLLFESFMLDEQNADLTREEGMEIFERQHEQKYDDMEDVLTKRQHTVDVRQAKDNLTKMQSEAMQAKSKDEPAAVPQEEMDALYNEIDQSLEDFEGLAVPVEDGDEFKFIVESQEDRQVLQEAMKNPVQWLQDELAPLYNEQTGEIDMDGYQAVMATLVFAKELNRSLLNHGRNIGKVTQVKEMKNPSKRLEPSSTGPGVGTDARTHEQKVLDKLGEMMDNY